MSALAATLAALLVIWVTPAGDAILVRHARAAGGVRHVARVAAALEDAAAARGIAPELLAALALHESTLRHIRTPYGAGVLQINPRHRLASSLSWCEHDEPGCVRAFIDAGAAAFAESLAACGGDEWAALGHYRFGRGRCVRRARELLILEARVELLGARCVREDAQRWSLTAACAARERLRVEAMGGRHGRRRDP